MEHADELTDKVLYAMSEDALHRLAHRMGGGTQPRSKDQNLRFVKAIRDQKLEPSGNNQSCLAGFLVKCLKYPIRYIPSSPSANGAHGAISDLATMEQQRRDVFTPHIGEGHANSTRENSSSLQDEYELIAQYYRNATDQGELPERPTFPRSHVEYHYMAKKELLQDLASALRWIDLQSQAPQTAVIACGTNAHEDEVSRKEVHTLKVERDGLLTRLDNAMGDIETMRNLTEQLRKAKADAEALAKDSERDEKETRVICQVLRDERDRYLSDLIRHRRSVWTFARIRPRIERDSPDQSISLASPDISKYHQSLVLRGSDFGPQVTDAEFIFDHVFHASDSNLNVYAYMKPFVHAVLDGQNAAIILDGPSGAGKSYTLFHQLDGVSFQLAEHIFEPRRHGSHPVQILDIKLFSFKIYNEQIFKATDRKRNSKLHIANSNDGIYMEENHRTLVEGQKVTTAQELKAAFEAVDKTRDKRPTEQNDESSRGHTICKLEFSLSSVDTGGVKKSSLFLVDLAGPEGYEHSTDGKETIGISQSRRVCHDCMRDRVNICRSGRKAKDSELEKLRFKLKDSMLTRLLRDCFLLEDSRMLLMTAVSPHCAPQHRSRIRETFEFVTSLARLGKP
ncbi:MAG: hypothetical protein Q9218_002255 [Villophora microphyllina]